MADDGDSDGFEGNPVIGLGVHELSHFGGDLDRLTARMLLSHWRHRHQLTAREFVAILRRFPESRARV